MTTPVGGFYAKTIQAACKDAKPEDLGDIEEVMRVERPTLDGLRKPDFDRLARKAWEAVKQLRVERPDLYPTPGQPKKRKK